VEDNLLVVTNADPFPESREFWIGQMMEVMNMAGAIHTSEVVAQDISLFTFQMLHQSYSQITHKRQMVEFSEVDVSE
jgi:hypothetical protein